MDHSVEELSRMTVKELQAAGEAQAHRMIAERAYRIYQKRSQTGQPGSAEEDWQQAIDEMSEANIIIEVRGNRVRVLRGNKW